MRMPHLHIRGTTESDGPKADVLGPLPPCRHYREAAPPADDVTAGREVLTTPVSTTAERSGWPDGRARSSPKWAAARLTCSTLADAATVIRRPIDPANRGRVHAHAAEALSGPAAVSAGGGWLWPWPGRPTP